MTDLVEQIGTDDPKLLSEWIKDGTPKETVTKEMVAGREVLKRLRRILDSKFQELANKEYDPTASDRALAMAAGQRKALREIYRLIQLDI